MGKASAIEWLSYVAPDGRVIPGHTWSPWEGCAKVSPGCAHCYAWARDGRHLIEAVDHWGADAPRLMHSEEYWRHPHRWSRWAEREGVRVRVFPSLCDPFEHYVGPSATQLDEARRRMWRVVRETPHLDWVLLTKRPENFRWMLPWMLSGDEAWPNVWLLVSCETQEHLDARVPPLLATRAIVRGVSAEPLLGPIDATRVLLLGRIDWVIVGGESGAGARSMRPEWARAIRDECRAAGVPFFFKQWGSKREMGRQLDGQTWDEFPRASEVRR